MDFLENNLSVMEKNRPIMYEKIKKILDEKEYSFDNIEGLDTKDGNKTLCITKAGQKYRLNSIYRPMQEAEKWADQYEFRNMDISVAMFGIGCSFFLKAMIDRMQPDAGVYAYEPDLPVFIYSLMNVDMAAILSDARVYLFVKGINEEEFYSTFDADFTWVNIDSQITCVHPAYDKIYQEDYKDFIDDVEKIKLLQVVNRNTESYMAIDSIQNVIKNIHFIKESNYIVELDNVIPEEVPAIVVSAGPSLDKNIDELKRAEGKAFILAADTAVKYLLAHNINFDGIVTLDARKSMAHFEDERCREIPLFCVLEAKNAFLEQHTGRKVWFRGSVYMYELYQKFERIFPHYNSGGSVSTGAFSICAALNFKRIVLIGQDLAYSDGATHAGGVVKNISGEAYDQKAVESVDGGMVQSRYDWLIFKDWFEASIKTLKDKIEVIDATEGGALIKGSKVMKLSEVIDEYCTCEFSVRDYIENMPYTFVGEEYVKVRNAILKLGTEFAEIRRKASEGLKAAKEMMKLINTGKSDYKKEQKCLKKISKVNKSVPKMSAYSLLDLYIMSSVTEKLQDINTLTDDADENMVQTLDISCALYEALIDGVDALGPILTEELKKV